MTTYENIRKEENGGDDDNDFYVSNNHSDDNEDDSGNDEQDALKGPLSPIHEEEKTRMAGNIAVPPIDHVQELEDNIMDVADKVSMASKLPGVDSFHLQDNDDDGSDGIGEGNDQEIGFEVATTEQDSSSPQRTTSEDHSSDDDEKANAKTKKRKETVQQVESVTPDISQRSMKQKRGRPKQVRISTVIGGTGYQVANREYRTIPAEEFEDHDEAPDGVRRSKRRRFRPLQFWKNEKIVYEPNREEGDLAEIFGDMPMVAGVQQAEPTPYKKRSIIRKIDKRESNDSDENGDDSKRKGDKIAKKRDNDEKPFDSSKLRKKYDIEDGDTAPIWWESKGLTLEKSKFF
jgi:hypothetical protein